MITEDKELLLKDLSARLPYGVRVQGNFKWGFDSQIMDDMRESVLDIETLEWLMNGIEVRPYLRPMSSMTEEECVELSRIRPFDDEVEAWKYIKTPVPLKIANIKHFDFFHLHHLDWRGLIEKGLALEAPEGMYK